MYFSFIFNFVFHQVIIFYVKNYEYFENYRSVNTFLDIARFICLYRVYLHVLGIICMYLRYGGFDKLPIENLREIDPSLIPSTRYGSAKTPTVQLETRWP